MMIYNFITAEKDTPLKIPQSKNHTQHPTSY